MCTGGCSGGALCREQGWAERVECWCSCNSPIKSSGSGTALPSYSTSQGARLLHPYHPQWSKPRVCATLKPRLLNLTIFYQKDCCLDAPAPGGCRACQELYSKWCRSLLCRALLHTIIMVLLWLAINSTWSFPATDTLNAMAAWPETGLLAWQPAPPHSTLWPLKAASARLPPGTASFMGTCCRVSTSTPHFRVRVPGPPLVPSVIGQVPRETASETPLRLAHRRVMGSTVRSSTVGGEGGWMEQREEVTPWCCLEDGVRLGSEVALESCLSQGGGAGGQRLTFSTHPCHWMGPVPTSSSAL